MIYVLLVIIVGLLCLNAALLWIIAGNQKASHNNMIYKLNALTQELRDMNCHIQTVEMIMNVVADKMEKDEKSDGLC